MFPFTAFSLMARAQLAPPVPPGSALCELSSLASSGLPVAMAAPLDVLPG